MLNTGVAHKLVLTISSRFVKEGAREAVVDLDRDQASRAVQRLDTSAVGLALHLTQKISIMNALDRKSKDLVPPDLLVKKAAAITLKGNFVDLDTGAQNASIAVNFMGALPVSRAVILIMRSGIGSAIINIASTLCKLAVENASAYRASKGELLQLSRAMALDHTKDCKRVNPISRGPVRN